MRNFLIALVLSSLCSYFHQANAQITPQPNYIVQYCDSAKIHARALTSYKKQLLIAASDGKLYSYNAKDASVGISCETKSGEYRDVIVSRKNIVLLASGASSATVTYHKKSGEINTIPFADQFMDGFALGKKTIFMMGDPIDGKFNLFHSENFGRSWFQLENSPVAADGEAGFAASGTNVRMISRQEWFFVSGGMASKLYHTKDAGQTWTASDMGFPSCPTCGAYSFVVLPNQYIVAVGGDYLQPDKGLSTCRISKDGGKTWSDPISNLKGYRSNVIFHKGILYACGTNGIDFSVDFGNSWSTFSHGNYFTQTIFQNQLVASSVNGSLYFFELVKADKWKK